MSQLTHPYDNHAALFNELQSYIFQSPNDSINNLLSLLTQNEDAHRDAYSLAVITAIGLNYQVLGDYSNAILYINRALQSAEKFSDWQFLVYNYNTMGTIYIQSAMYEKALEVFLMIINIERQHNLIDTTPSAYINIGRIYSLLDDKRSLQNFFHGYTFLESHKSTIKCYPNKVIHYLGCYIIELCKYQQIDEARKFMPKFSDLVDQCINNSVLIAASNTYMYYALYQGNINDTQKHCNDLVTYLNQFGNPIDKFRYIVDFAETCIKLNCDTNLYIPLLESLNIDSIKGHPAYVVKCLYMLLVYYYTNNLQEKIEKTSKHYIKYSKINQEQIKQHHLYTLDIIYNSVNNKEEILLAKHKNKSLIQLTEALSIKTNELKRSEKQLSLIYAIGQKITSSHDLNKIVELIYNDLKQIIPMTVFGLLIKNDTNAILDSVSFFMDNTKSERIYINLKEKHNLIANSFLNNQLIHYHNFCEEVKTSDNQINPLPDKPIRSVLIIPIAYNCQVIGVCTIQHRKQHMFTDSHKSLLNQLVPYLAISLSNAMHAKMLVKEINAKEKAQHELESLNQKLQKLSLQDELTQIFNRRAFSPHYTALLSRAKEHKMPLYVCMMDIDCFKKYNDTYGHIKGDNVLIEVSRCINAHFKNKNSVFARFGGEEFIGAEIGKSYEDALKKAEIIRNEVIALQIKNIKAPLKLVTISIGIAYCHYPTRKFKSELILVADKQLYKSKKCGRNTVSAKKL